MSTRREIVDQNGATLRVFHFDEARPDEFVIESRENVSAVLASIERTREFRARNPLRDMRHLAEIPMSVVEQAMREGWWNDKAKWKRFLNDPENASLRIEGGRV